MTNYSDFFSTGELDAFKLYRMDSSSVRLRKGKWVSEDKILISGNVTTDEPVDITLDLTSLVATPAANTTYWLCIDTYGLGSAYELTDTFQKVIRVYDTTHFAVVASDYDALWTWRYIPIGTVRTPGSTTWVGSTIKTLPSRVRTTPSTSVSPTLISSTKQSISTLGSSGQIRAGHILNNKSFPASALDTAKLSFYNLNADVNDDYGTRNLTNNGAFTFSGTNIHGTASSAVTLASTSSQYLSISNAFFDPGDVNFTVGGWFSANDWTPSAINAIFCNEYSATDMGFSLYVATDGSFLFAYPITASTYGYVIIPNPGFTDGSWHHFAIKYDATLNMWYVFIDALIVTSVEQVNINTTTDSFKIGALRGPQGFFNGKVQDVFFVNNVSLLEEDIKKLYSYRYDHLKNILPERQEWSFNLWRDTETFATPVKENIIVDMSDQDSCFWDLSGMGTTDKIDICLQNKGADGSTAIPLSQYSKIITATGQITPTGTSYPTNLPEHPKSIQAWQYDGTSWQPKDLVGMLKISGASPWYVQGNIDDWTPSVANPVMIIVATLGMAVAVATADTTQAGVLPHVNYEKRQVITSAVTASADDVLLCNTTSGAFAVTLPTSPTVGDKVTLYDACKVFATYNLTVLRNGKTINGAASDYTCNTNGDKIEFIFINDIYGWATYAI